MNKETIEISFEYPDAYTKKQRFYTGKAIVQDAENGVYIAFDFLDENKKPPLNFSSEIFLHTKKYTSGKMIWVSPDRQHQNELLQIIGTAIENAAL
jgi:hypothetical protein